MTSYFFNDFLMISDWRTVLFLAALVVLMAGLWWLQRRKASFSRRVLTATGLGLLLGLAVQAVAGFPNQPMDTVFIRETVKWYGLVGNGFIALVRMLVIPLVMVSIVHVIIEMKGADLGRLARNTLAVTMIMVAIAAIVGLSLGLVFNVGAGFAAAKGESANNPNSTRSASC